MDCVDCRMGGNEDFFMKEIVNKYFLDLVIIKKLYSNFFL